MAPLADNLTDRLWVDYNDGQFSHSLLCRFNDAITDVGAAMDAVAALFLNIADSWYEITIEGARHSVQFTNVSNPVTWTGLTTYGAGAMPKVFAPRQFCLLGRTTNGRRWRSFLYGFEGTSPDEYRLARSSGNIVDDALDVIETAQANSIFIAADGLVPVLYQYADFNFNNYYEKQARG